VAVSENHLVALIRRSVTPVLIVDDDDVYADANDSLLRAFGRRREEVIGRRVGLLSAQTEQANDAWQRYRAAGSIVTSWTLGHGHDAVIVAAPAPSCASRPRSR
jgi:PAS domain S-box-containing protein